MADLSQYISIAVVLDKSQVSPVFKIIDNSNYPSGVAQTIAGILTVTQPDGITIANSNFGAPNIYWSGGALVPANLELRLDTSNSFQRGGSGYIVIYTVQAPGYTNTVLTKTFSIQYTPPTLVITNNFDIFTPDLSVQDSTTYTQPNVNFTSVVRAWTAAIISVNGTTQNTTGSGQNFDLNYLGSYYDSLYNIGLTVIPQYTLPGASGFVTLIDELVTAATYYAQIPPTLTALLASLTTLKSQVDAAICDCNTYQTLLARYNLASNIYSQLIYRGQSGSLAGLSTYVFQLEKIFNNNVNPTYVNTNQIIPPYDWGGGAGSVAWSAITGKPSTITVQWVVGAGGFPGAGATTYTDTRLAGIPATQVYVFRNGQPQFTANPGDGNTYITKNLSDNFLTFSAALGLSEEIIILILPL
jgi:hypothetical protein